MDQNTKDVLATVNFIKDCTATKDDVRDVIRNEVPQIVRGEIKDIRTELISIRRDLEVLTGKVDNIMGSGNRSCAGADRCHRKASWHEQEDRQRETLIVR